MLMDIVIVLCERTQTQMEMQMQMEKKTLELEPLPLAFYLDKRNHQPLRGFLSARQDHCHAYSVCVRRCLLSMCFFNPIYAFIAFIDL